METTNSDQKSNREVDDAIFKLQQAKKELRDPTDYDNIDDFEADMIKVLSAQEQADKVLKSHSLPVAPLAEHEKEQLQSIKDLLDQEFPETVTNNNENLKAFRQNILGFLEGVKKNDASTSKDIFKRVVDELRKDMNRINSKPNGTPFRFGDIPPLPTPLKKQKSDENTETSNLGMPIVVYINGTKTWQTDGCFRLKRLYGGTQKCIGEHVLHREDGPSVEYADGTKEWYYDGQLHRDDGPAIERPIGSNEWYKHGLLHREDGPAIESPYGLKFWYKDGVKHREDGPAVEYPNGDREWWQNGKLHRKDGPAIEGPDETKKWYQYGKLHRSDGPAVEYSNGTTKWYFDDELHRENGPAIETVSGTKEWWKHGEFISLD